MENDRLIVLGERLNTARKLDVWPEDPSLVQHVKKPWMMDYVREREGVSLKTATPVDNSNIVGVPVSLLGRHAVILGAAGQGKTRMTLHLLTEQLKAGCSAVILDIKEETCRQALSCGITAGLSKRQITAIWPSNETSGIPGWNPFAGVSRDVRQSVEQFVDIIATMGTPMGARMEPLLRSAAQVVASQGLSVIELVAILQSEVYRNQLLKQGYERRASSQFPEAYDYFTREFSRLNQSAQIDSCSAVLNRIRELAAHPYLRAMFGAERDTLDLPSYWKSQKLLVVHLGTSLGDRGIRIVAGMLAEGLYRTAMNKPGNVPVVLCLDEIGRLEQAMGETVAKTIDVARQQGLRVLAATQQFGQLSEHLRCSLTTSTALQVYFRLGFNDAPLVATAIATHTGGQMERVSLHPVKERDGLRLTERTYVIYNEHGAPLSVTANAWEAFSRLQTSGKNQSRTGVWLTGSLYKLVLESGITRLYVRAEPGHAIELTKVLEGIAISDFRFDGPSPMSLTVTFPVAKVRIESSKSDADMKSEALRTLLEMPPREAIVRAEGGLKARIRSVRTEFPTNLPPMSDYLGNGQTAEEIRRTFAKRRDAILDRPVVVTSEVTTPAVQREPVPVTKQPKRPAPKYVDFGVITKEADGSL